MNRGEGRAMKERRGGGGSKEREGGRVRKGEGRG
jgi:hypothetical protein